MHVYIFFFFKQKTAYEMRISDWSSDVCSSDLTKGSRPMTARTEKTRRPEDNLRRIAPRQAGPIGKLQERSEEHTSELQSLMRISYAVFCLKKKKTTTDKTLKTHAQI